MQPLPEMPSGSVPNISAQQELLVPGDAISIQAIDPIITGPRAYKPRAPMQEALLQRDSERRPFTIWFFDLGTKNPAQTGLFQEHVLKNINRYLR